MFEQIEKDGRKELIASQSDPKLELQRCKEKYFDALTVDCVMLEVQFWMRQLGAELPKSVFWKWNSFFENQTAETELLVLNFAVSSVQFLVNQYQTFSIGSAQP